jgi:hypothetical protein
MQASRVQASTSLHRSEHPVLVILCSHLQLFERSFAVKRARHCWAQSHEIEETSSTPRNVSNLISGTSNLTWLSEPP